MAVSHWVSTWFAEGPIALPSFSVEWQLLVLLKNVCHKRRVIVLYLFLEDYGIYVLTNVPIQDSKYLTIKATFLSGSDNVVL